MSTESIKYINYRVRAEIDVDSSATGWDGDYPLDPERNWTPYVLFFEGQCTSCKEWHDIDSISGCWATDDEEGMRYLDDCIRDYFTSPRGIDFDDLEFVGLS